MTAHGREMFPPARYHTCMIDIVGIEARVRTYAAARTPALAAAEGVIAVSGGADSIATAALLAEAGIVRPEGCIVAHFDHRLRDALSAERDRAAVDALCARYGFAMELGAWSDPRPGEATARDARYGFLAGVADRHGVSVIVTGHTSSDQVETVVMNTLRGAGLRGIAGMRPQRALNAGLQLARPMLCVSHEETRSYCAGRDLVYHDDATNADRRFLRNRVRIDVLPGMLAADTGAISGLIRVADDARDALAALDAQADLHLAAATVGEAAASVTLSRATLNGVPPTIAPYVWRLVLERLLGDARDFGRRHYQMMAAAGRAATGSVFELPRGVRITVDAGVLVVSVGTAVATSIDAGIACAIPFDGTLGAWRITVTRADHAVPGAIILPAAAVVRARRAGDRIQPHGMRGQKKLQDYYVDKKIARRHRDAAPLIAHGRDVLWTPFGAASPVADGDAFRIDAQPVRDGVAIQ